MKKSVYVEYQSKQVDENDILVKIKEAWVADGNLIKDIKTLNMYIKPEDNACYYSINETIEGKVDLY